MIRQGIIVIVVAFVAALRLLVDFEHTDKIRWLLQDPWFVLVCLWIVVYASTKNVLLSTGLVGGIQYFLLS